MVMTFYLVFYNFYENCDDFLMIMNYSNSMRSLATIEGMLQKLCKWKTSKNMLSWWNEESVDQRRVSVVGALVLKASRPGKGGVHFNAKPSRFFMRVTSWSTFVLYKIGFPIGWLFVEIVKRSNSGSRIYGTPNSRGCLKGDAVWMLPRHMGSTPSLISQGAGLLATSMRESVSQRLGAPNVGVCGDAPTVVRHLCETNPSAVRSMVRYGTSAC